MYLSNSTHLIKNRINYKKSYRFESTEVSKKSMILIFPEP